MVPLSVLPVASVTLPSTPPTSAPSHTATGFGASMAAAFQHLNAVNTQAAQAISGGLTGQASITQAMVATVQAQTSLDVASSIRNALLQGTQTLLNLQI